MSHLLVTGGAGFIGSHTCPLFKGWIRITVLDNFENSCVDALHHVIDLAKSLLTIEGDIRDNILLISSSENQVSMARQLMP